MNLSNKDSKDLNEHSRTKFTLEHQNKHWGPLGPSHHRSFSLRVKKKNISDNQSH